MKFAILSDIHGNIFALEECFKYIEKMDVDGIIWCGDYITDVPRSHEVIEFIKNSMKKYKTYIVKGNREDYIINYNNSINKFWKMDNRNGPFLLVYKELTNEDIEFISNLKDTCVIDLPNGENIFVSHYKDAVCEETYTYKIFGHTHDQEIFEKDGVKYINSGAVGVPRQGNVCAHFSILEINDKNNKVEMHEVQYNIDDVIQSVKESELKDTIIKWDNAIIKTFETGKHYTLLYVLEVIRIAKERNLGEDLDKIPIEIWHEARNNLQI